MPHITLEYTSNINQKIETKHIFEQTHKILNEIAGISIDNCKSRAIVRSEFYIGDDNSNKAFVHMDIAFLEGRQDKLKSKIGNEILNTLEEYFQESFKTNDLQVSLEIRDIIKKYYFKKPALN